MRCESFVSQRPFFSHLFSLCDVLHRIDLLRHRAGDAYFIVVLTQIGIIETSALPQALEIICKASFMKHMVTSQPSWYYFKEVHHHQHPVLIDGFPNSLKSKYTTNVSKCFMHVPDL